MFRKIFWSAGFFGIALVALFISLQTPSARSNCSNGADWLACLRGTAGSQAQIQPNPYN
jgi:hypothetical protein